MKYKITINLFFLCWMQSTSIKNIISSWYRGFVLIFCIEVDIMKTESWRRKHSEPSQARLQGMSQGWGGGPRWRHSAGCAMLNGLVIPLIKVVFPPQSTYWYISWDTCSEWPKYVVVTVTLQRVEMTQCEDKNTHSTYRKQIRKKKNRHAKWIGWKRSRSF